LRGKQHQTMDIFRYFRVMCGTPALKRPDLHTAGPLPVEGPLPASSFSTIGYVEVYGHGMKSVQR